MIGELSKKEIKEMLDILAQTYPEAECALDHGSIYQLLVAVVLSAQTTDKSVNRVTPAFFAKYPDAESLARAAAADEQAAIAEVSEFIRSIGMYRTKAKNVVRLAQKLTADFGGVVPQDFEKLQELPGVGRKTANVVLAVGFGENRMPVDTHVLRVSHRIGLVTEKDAGLKDALATEKALLSVIPEKRLTEAHHSLIFHGRYCCDARRPQCDTCPISKICKRHGV